LENHFYTAPGFAQTAFWSALTDSATQYIKRRVL